MSGNAFIDLMDDVQEQSLERCMDLTMALIESQLGPDGNAYGDTPMTRDDRIARFEDYARRGVLDALRQMGAPVYDQLVREYRDDMAHVIGGRR